MDVRELTRKLEVHVSSYPKFQVNSCVSVTGVIALRGRDVTRSDKQTGNSMLLLSPQQQVAGCKHPNG